MIDSEQEEKTWCWPLMHKWNQSADTKTGTLHEHYTEAVKGFFIMQERRCSRCNKVQRRSVSTYT